ncbi:MAG TPA: FeoA family protein [Rectinemataceae bacterium]|nr:FeoA family protein [Rectinemataceae bacterium]
MNISDLPVGAAFTVRKVRSGREVGKRLVDMGFTEGASGRLLRKAFLSGPLQVEIRGYDVIIRRSEAAMIEVAEDDQGAGDARTA